MSDTIAIIADGQLHYSNVLKTEKCKIVDKLLLQQCARRYHKWKEQRPH